jgi:hypothetical protein
MTTIPERLKSEIRELGGDDIGKRDLWMFAPLIAVLAALPLAIVAVLSASLWFATHTDDRYNVASFASRFDKIYTR